MPHKIMKLKDAVNQIIKSLNENTEKMTDSLKLAEMQRTSIEFERQRHLANWFIKSSQHMATPPTINPNGSSNSNNSNGNSNKAQKTNGSKNGTITATSNPLFFIVSGQKPPPPPQLGGNLAALSRSQIFTSQTNLPLQIVTTSSQEGHKPKLRRFNSHDTSANMFSVADFENARLARRNDIEMKQRQQQRLKMNSLSSGGDCSTGDSKGSKYSSESQPEPLPADVFLDRYSLPRVVRISHKPKFSHETLQSSSSNGSSSTNSSTSVTNKPGDTSKHQNGELYLLYRYLRQRKIYHGYNTKSGNANRKKGVMIPQEFPGYFSMINDKGVPTATMYTTLVQLVRERVYKFISVENLPAFTESQSSDTFHRSHYVKSTARAGQIFRLLAVFEDGKQENSTTSVGKTSTSSGREKEKRRYAQLLNENRQILYVSLTSKGKFYEIEQGVPQILQKSGAKDEASKKINPDCVHRLSKLITPSTTFPLNVKFISGPAGTVNHVPENLTITRISTEEVLIACPIEDVEARSPLHLRKLYVIPEMTLMKCFLGFENEQRMLANPNVQNLLKFCQFNCDNFTKSIEFEMLNRPERSTSRSKVDGLKILKPLNFPKLLRREKSSIAHEKEDSIIFLSKNDLANLEAKEEAGGSSTAVDQARINDKMKVFQPTKKKWFKKTDKQTSLTSLDLDVQAKRMSMERYHDMSKLLQERFGDIMNESTTSERPISEIGCSDQDKPKIQKSLSLQEVDFIDKPDLVPVHFAENFLGGSQDNLHHEVCVDDPNTSSTNLSVSQHNGVHPQQQSFISEKMYSEFHVKTRQYSKSSSSLHQLLHFAVPQRMNIVETKKQLLLRGSINNGKEFSASRKQMTNDDGSRIMIHASGSTGGGGFGQGFNRTIGTHLSPTTIIDDLPYSSVRDSLLTADDYHGDDINEGAIGTVGVNFEDEARENIYAEICHDGGAVSRVQINVTTAPNLEQFSSSVSSDVFASTKSQITGASIDNIYNTLK